MIIEPDESIAFTPSVAWNRSQTKLGFLGWSMVEAN